MYTNVWNKYLPVIRILIKKSINADQLLDLNISDFERAGLGRKSGYKFNVVFNKGKVDNVIIASPLASNLATLLLNDPVIKELFLQNLYAISMNTKFQLGIKCTPGMPLDSVKEEAEAMADQA
jgi:hypothetical protein